MAIEKVFHQYYSNLYKGHDDIPLEKTLILKKSQSLAKIIEKQRYIKNKAITIGVVFQCYKQD